MAIYQQKPSSFRLGLNSVTCSKQITLLNALPASMHYDTNAHVNANMEQILKQETETAPVAKRKREKM